MINNFSNHHIGHLPIRVLQFNILEQFESTTPSFSELKKEVVEKYGLNKKINYNFNVSKALGDKVRGPYILDSTKQINIDESFLAYFWCMCYSLSVLTDNLLEEKNKKTLEGAEALAKYAQSLLREYSDWNKQELINPETYTEEDQFDIERANAIYIYGLNFLICHEFQHVKLGHIDKKQSKILSDQEILENEIEADKEAIELILLGRNTSNTDHINIGIATALCAVLFMSSSVAKTTHPDSDTRIITAINQLGVEDNDLVWLIACTSLNIWFNVFDINNVHWSEETHTFKEQFIYLSQQLE